MTSAPRVDNPRCRSPGPAAGGRDPSVPSNALASDQVSRLACPGAPDPCAIVTPPELRATCSAATSSATVGLPSTTRARRNQVVNGNARTVRSATSDRSRTTSPNPPACRTRFIALSARVASPVSRIHNSVIDRGRRPRPMPDRNDRRYRRAPPARRAGRGRERTAHHRRSSRRSSADDLRQMTARAARRQARRRAPARRWPRDRRTSGIVARRRRIEGRGARQGDVELPGFEQRFEVRARGLHGVNDDAIFAFSSP